MIAVRVLALAILANAVTCFKSCSEVPFCSKFRNHKSTEAEHFQAVVSDYGKDGDALKVPLNNVNKQQLELHLSFLKNGTLRLKIREPKSDRYELKDVLVQEPDTVKYDVVEKSDKLIKVRPQGNNDVDVVIYKGPPFVLDFHYKNESYIVLNSSELIMENDKDSQAFSFNVDFEGSTNLYGLHHHADRLSLRETVQTNIDPYRLRNVDAGAYPTNSTKPLYGAVPVIYGHSPARTYGVFLHNAAQQWVDISYKNQHNPNAHFMVEGGSLDLFIFFGPTFKDVVRQYVNLTGKMHMPQLWTLGYHQCRYSYMTQYEVMEVASNMEIYDFPMDAVWLDIDYTDGKKYFTWNPTNYSDPAFMQKYLALLDKKLVTIIDPHIKVDDQYPVYKGAKGKYFVKWANGSDFQGECWPGLSSYIDFFNPEARKYIADWYQYEKFNGSTETLAGIWNDMNEPSVFNVPQWENTFPHELVHHGGVKHRDVHNMYGFMQTMATHDGLMKRDNGKRRPFILTRSHFAGSQRYAAVWTGDNTADWPHMQVTYSECLLANLVGHPFCGADMGGFFNDPEVELLQRWYQVGVWLPFYRGHANKDTKRHEPYLLPKPAQDVVRSAIKNRYRHLPVFYTLLYQHVKSGDPVVRPLFYEYPEMTYINDDHVLVGSDILGAPVMEKGAKTRTVYLPGDKNTYWYRADLPVGNWTVHQGGTNKTFDVDISTSPYFYKAGSIVVLTEEQRTSTTGLLKDRFTVYVNADADGNAKGYLYLDDGVSFDYATADDFCLLELQFSEKNGLTVKQIDGKMKPVFNTKIVKHNIPKSGNEAVLSA